MNGRVLNVSPSIGGQETPNANPKSFSCGICEQFVAVCRLLFSVAVLVLAVRGLLDFTRDSAHHKQLMKEAPEWLERVRQIEREVRLNMEQTPQEAFEKAKNLIIRDFKTSFDGRTNAVRQSLPGGISLSARPETLFLDREAFLHPGKTIRVGGDGTLRVPQIGDVFTVVSDMPFSAYDKPNWAAGLPWPLQAGETVTVRSQVQDFIEIGISRDKKAQTSQADVPNLTPDAGKTVVGHDAKPPLPMPPVVGSAPRGSSPRSTGAGPTGALSSELVTGTIETQGAVPLTFEARGTITGALTDRQKVWVVGRKKGSDRTNLHWPKGHMAGPVFVTNVIFADGGRWTALVYENSPEGFELLLVIVDDLGQTQIRNWGKNADDTGNWVGMPTIAGMTILARVEIKTAT